MRRYLRLLGEYFLQYAKVRMAYRADFLIAVAASLAATAAGLGFVLVLFGRIPRLMDWGFSEILFLYGFALVPLSLFNVISINLYYFGERYVVQGNFDRVLLRPVHSLFQILCEQFRLESLSDLAIGIGVMIYAARRLDLALGITGWLALGLAAVCGFVIYVSVFVLLACVSFWVEDRVGVMPPVYNLLAFGRYPLKIYSGFLQFLLSWVVPFALATYYPSAHLLGRGEYPQYFLAVPAAAAAFGAAAVAVWNRGVRNYSSTGS